MDTTQKIQALNRLLEKSKDVKVEDSSDPDFQSWKNLCERTFIKVFGENSKEVEQISSLKFFYSPLIGYLGEDYSAEHLRCFREDYAILIKTINLLIEELKETGEDSEPKNGKVPKVLDKIFISHSSKDKNVVEELIDLLESMGVKPSQIFCSSFEGYGIPLGSDFLETIREEISKNVLVLFVLSENFYSSPVCLCEMGATWVLSRENIPIIVPPFTFDEIKGVIPLIQGLEINDSLKLNLLREKITEMFGISSQPMSSWERKRDRAVARINQKTQNA
jgi:hypothetical protein